jgi:hypothetical protein
MSLTGRLTHSQPEIQNLPGTLADKLAKAFQSGRAAHRADDYPGIGLFIERLVTGKSAWETIHRDVVYLPAGELAYLQFKSKWQEAYIEALLLMRSEYAQVEANHWLDFDPYYPSRKTAEHVTIKVRRK